MVYLFGILSARKLSVELIFLWPFSWATIILYSASVQIRKKNLFLKTLYCHLLDIVIINAQIYSFHLFTQTHLCSAQPAQQPSYRTF